MADPTRRHGPLDDDRLRAAYQAAGDGAEPHLSESEWEQLACGELDADATARAHAHITVCSRCAEIYRSLDALAGGAVQFDPGAVRPAPAAPVSRTWMILGGLATAAAIIMAVNVDWRPLGTAGQAGVTRTPRATAQMAVVTPTAESSLEGQRFAWQPIATADGYELKVNTTDGGAVWSSRTTATELIVPAERRLGAGGYYWQVTAVRENAVIAASPLIAFRVE